MIYFDELDIYKKIYDDERNISIYKINNVNIISSNLYYPNILLSSNIIPIREKSMSLDISYNNFKINNNIIINNIENTPVFFFIYNTNNYLHFIYDTLPYLISFFELKKEIPNLKLLIQYPHNEVNELYKYIKEFYDLLDLDYIFVNNYTKYSELYISSSYTHGLDSNKPPHYSIFDFFLNISKKVNDLKPSFKLYDNVYISRRTWIHNDMSNIGTNYTTRRYMENENQLVEILEKNNYKEIFCENQSIIEKIYVLNNAKKIIGLSSGGIINIIFCNKNTEIIIIESPLFFTINKRIKYAFINQNVIYFDKCYHLDDDLYKLNMRVKTTDNKYGEIDKIEHDFITLRIVDSYLEGWDLNKSFNLVKYKKKDIIIIDNGINSPFKIDLEEFIKLNI
jgi:hypothetical protein